MAQEAPVHIQSISQYHRLLGLAKPEHSLVSVSRFEDVQHNSDLISQAVIHNFYSIALKKTFHARLKYGQQEVDFDEGVLLLMAPLQVFAIEGPQEPIEPHQGWLLLVHPDLLWHTHLATKIRHYEFFGYKANEALHLSEREEQILVGLMQSIQQEYRHGVDDFSQDVIVAQLELLLTYAQRFYHRQFMTRKASSHQLLNRLEDLLDAYFVDDKLPSQGVPTVAYLSDALHLSPNYLSRLLKTLTGQTTKQFILSRVIELAKEKLSTTNLTIAEIAYALGFEHPQSFNKFFKTKTNLTPMAFRQSFN
ncbi:helix-turn-helix domain-containing protein [Spirosoma rhododendri]|uniref:Helix-turn-helix transcriptional regulator n=1 Tax=Spirosoma rhododendri TaxID=2728024 RepID=A0A7L5DVN5_9BACT|nr:helix-turn-helix transcriptional regulator [Spirosoma rhododendri]QJD81652.1 helix-turn-helix transcriptional regulator [Spirosoma rhododendri]